MSKKDCMFQYTVVGTGFFRDYKPIEDTGLITRAEADKLWLKYKDDFVMQLKREDTEPEMGIWINCKDNTDYHTCIAHLDSDTKWDGRRFYREVIEYIDVPTEATGVRDSEQVRANTKPKSKLAKSKKVK